MTGSVFFWFTRLGFGAGESSASNLILTARWFPTSIHQPRQFFCRSFLILFLCLLLGQSLYLPNGGWYKAYFTMAQLTFTFCCSAIPAGSPSQKKTHLSYTWGPGASPGAIVSGSSRPTMINPGLDGWSHISRCEWWWSRQWKRGVCCTGADSNFSQRFTDYQTITRQGQGCQVDFYTGNASQPYRRCFQVLNHDMMVALFACLFDYFLLHVS